ncbi:hypothetical protein [Chitinophaga sp.]|uniref:hypothetical protein n=1 Tax=Chitinophaga sp. TaxID=1869181 RepID=UPI002C21F95C|nr:hypothetical protein [Chitinophaga sp.]HWV68780.1 hypothetical protein [Chitinophaga sp.]
MINKDELNENAFSEEENNDLPEEQTAADADAEVSEEEKELLEEASTTDPTYSEELRMRGAKVDNRDDDGDPLNEAGSLDVPGAELDDAQEQIGAEDEENNEYSNDKND